MAKIKIAQDPTFKADVQIPRVGSDPVTVSFDFRYLDRVALAEMFDRWNTARDAWADKAKEEGISWKEATAAEIQLQAEQLKDILVGWDLDDAFSDDAILDLVRTCTSAPRTVIEVFQNAYSPARLGN